MSKIGFEIIIIAILILANGLFAMSEMALVYAKRGRLQQRADDGNRGAKIALTLLEQPTRFLSTIQVGITLIGILNGAIAGATIAEEISTLLGKIPVLEPYREELAVVIVVLMVTYLSLLFGELLPKQIALSNAERLAETISPFMRFFAVIGKPIVNILSFSTDGMLKLLRVKKEDDSVTMIDDVKYLIAEGTEKGVFNLQEQVIVSRVFRLADKTANFVMTPYTDIEFIDVNNPVTETLTLISESGFSRFPVFEGTQDNVIGILDVKDILTGMVDKKEALNIRAILREAVFIPESATVLELLDRIKETYTDMIIVIDEYAGVLGLVTINDVLEGIVGNINSNLEFEEPEAICREDGSWLFDGMLQTELLKEFLDIEELPSEEETGYTTLNGMVMAKLGRIPVSGDTFEWHGYRFDVVDMDGRRVDKVLVQKNSQRKDN